MHFDVLRVVYIVRDSMFILASTRPNYLRDSLLARCQNCGWPHRLNAHFVCTMHPEYDKTHRWNEQKEPMSTNVRTNNGNWNGKLRKRKKELEKNLKSGKINAVNGKSRPRMKWEHWISPHMQWHQVIKVALRKHDFIKKFALFCSR